MATVEIIDFTRPVANSKNLFVTNIKTDELNEAQITSALYEACIPFGLLYEIQVFPLKTQTFKPRQSHPEAAYYAFVKFYSYHSAQKARRDLNNTLKLGAGYCKVCNAKRCKETEEGRSLYMAECQALANHYLGFNGWTSAIRCLEQDREDGDHQEPQVRFFCVVDLNFPHQGLRSHGIGAWEESYSPQDTGSKSTALHKARKRSYHRALEHAFARVLLVVVGGRRDLDGGEGRVKVTVEIDTTQPDDLTESMRSRVAQEQVLTVNELTEAPREDDDEEEEEEEGGDDRKSSSSSRDPGDLSAMPDNVDEVNLHLLQELGEGTT